MLTSSMCTCKFAFVGEFGRSFEKILCSLYTKEKELKIDLLDSQALIQELTQSSFYPYFEAKLK